MEQNTNNLKTASMKSGHFSCSLTNNTELGLAVLMAEFDDGSVDILSVVGTIAEAIELANEDRSERMDNIVNFQPAETYRVDARGIEGRYHTAATWDF